MVCAMPLAEKRKSTASSGSNLFEVDKMLPVWIVPQHLKTGAFVNEFMVLLDIKHG